MNKFTDAERYQLALTNRDKLDNCKKHRFNSEGISLYVGVQLACTNCGGHMDAVQAFRYCQGYEAAGGNPNDIIDGFREEPARIWTDFDCWNIVECLRWGLLAESKNESEGNKRAMNDLADQYWQLWCAE